MLFYRLRKLILRWRRPGNHVLLMQLLFQGLEIHNVKRVHYPLRRLLITTSRTWTDYYVLCVSPWKLSATRLQAVAEIMPLLATYFCTALHVLSVEKSKRGYLGWNCGRSLLYNLPKFHLFNALVICTVIACWF